MDYVINKNKIKIAMEAKGLSSLGILSRICFIHRNTLYPLVRGERSPFTNTYLAVCRALDIDPVECLVKHRRDNAPSIEEVASSVFAEYQKNFPDLCLFLFGSRATGKAKEFSDYDIGMTGGRHPIGGLDFLRIQESILERCDNMPFKVDVLNFDSAPTNFLIDFDSPLLLLAGSKESLAFLEGGIHAQSKNKAA